jgi:hypothetical protein
MSSAICPVNAPWVHKHIVEPIEEGIRRLDLVSAPYNTYSLNRTPLTLKDRAVFLITGIALVFFPINAIVWIAMQTFGHTKRLSDPFNPETSHPAVPPLPAISPAPAASIPETPRTQARPGEIFTFRETKGQTVVAKQWTVRPSPELIQATQEGGEQFTSSFYNPDWTLKEFHHQTADGAKQCDFWVRGPRVVEVRLVVNGEETQKTLHLEEERPIIQQPTLGFKRFVTGPLTEERFYGIAFENKVRMWNPFATRPPFAIPMVARKKGTETVEGLGPLQKVGVASEWGWPYSLAKGDLWFDGEGNLRKFHDQLEGVIGIRNSPSPAPAHP